MMSADLDPGAPAIIVQFASGSLDCGQSRHFGLRSFCQNLGFKGCDVCSPCPNPANYEGLTKGLCPRLGAVLEQEHPELVVSDMKKQLRTGKGSVDGGPERRTQDHDQYLFAAEAQRAPRSRSGSKWGELSGP